MLPAHLATGQQPADLVTKALPESLPIYQLHFIISKLGTVKGFTTPPLRGAVRERDEDKYPS